MNLEITLNKSLAEKVKTASALLNVEENTLIVKAIKRFIHTQEMALIRKQLKGIAKKNNFKTEQDIYNSIS
ncbi:MAG: hypothetical protein U0U67_05235 [Chitinophagales bacterium]